MSYTKAIFPAMLLCIFLTATITGCSGIAIQKAQAAYDKSLDNSVWWLCNGASVGSIRRKFGGTANSADLYKRLCSANGDVIR